MSQNQNGIARVKVGLVEFEAPISSFLIILTELIARLPALVNANNNLIQNKGQTAAAAAATPTTTTPTLQIPATLQTV